MLLRVTQRQTIWGFEDLHIVYNDTYPTEVTLDDLTHEAKIALTMAIRRGILFEVDTNDKPVRKLVSAAQTPIKDSVNDADVPKKMKQVMEAILDKSVTKIRKEIVNIKHLKLLEYGIAFESQNKKRTTVINLLKEILTKSQTPKDADALYDNSITEEEIETIECVVPAKDSES